MKNNELNELNELKEQQEKLNKKIKEIENQERKQRLEEIEKKYLGHCYKNENIIFKIVCVASTNEYRVSIIGFKKAPVMINEQDIFDKNFHRHPFQGETTLDFVIEDDIMIQHLKNYTEINKEEFEKELKESTEKLMKEMKKEFKLDVNR